MNDGVIKKSQFSHNSSKSNTLPIKFSYKAHIVHVMPLKYLHQTWELVRLSSALYEVLQKLTCCYFYQNGCHLSRIIAPFWLLITKRG